MKPVILEKDQSTGSLELAKLLPHVQQHFLRPNIPLYYLDFTLSALLGNVFLLLATFAESWSAAQALYVFLAAIALFRANVFIHEAYHVGKQLKGFIHYFNALHGFLHKLPMYCYTTHRYHHQPDTYGTMKDPEYEVLGDKSVFYNLVFAPLVMMMILPVFLIVRWGILPFILPFMGRNIREKVYMWASTLEMNMQYERSAPTEAEKQIWVREDAGCALYTLATLWLVYAGVLPWHIIVVWYVVFYLISVMNFYRAMINHRYFSSFESTTHKQQVIDSITLPFSWANSWVYPLGLGYHALHHMFPQIPYHNIGKAHRWLMQTLPENHPYRHTVIGNYFIGVKHLLEGKF